MKKSVEINRSFAAYFLENRYMYDCSTASWNPRTSVLTTRFNERSTNCFTLWNSLWRALNSTLTVKKSADSLSLSLSLCLIDEQRRRRTNRGGKRRRKIAWRTSATAREEEINRSELGTRPMFSPWTRFVFSTAKHAWRLHPVDDIVLYLALSPCR